MPGRDDYIWERIDWLRELLGRAVDSDDLLDESSLQFASDMKDRVDEYGDLTRVSPAQMRWLESIEARLNDERYRTKWGFP